MDHFKKLQNQVTLRLWGVFLAVAFLTSSTVWSLTTVFEWPAIVSLVLAASVSALFSLCVALMVVPALLEPVRVLWQAILHMSPSYQNVSAPNLEAIRLGHELLTSLVMQVYQLASQNTNSDNQTDHRAAILQAANIVTHLPLPMFVCNKQQFVINVSETALDYCAIDSSRLLGKPLVENVNLEFPSEFTLETWMNDCQAHKVTDTAYWERVRVRLKNDDKTLRQCDMAAYYNRDNPSGTEFIITLFDRTERYQQDDKSLNFVAMAVHELRTPLTMMRGYIEVFEEEVAPKLEPELKDFMYKMQVSAEQLTSFVNNILNVARVEDDQLELSLTEENWSDVLKRAVEDNTLRARVHGKSIVLKIEDNLPPVAVDRVSIYEVVNNLLDNAIKYSADSKEIIVTSTLSKEGMVETTVRDFGVGIPASVLPNLFEKFYRNHRTRSSIGGTGLGLYLSKAIVNAHGGQIWAESKEAEGSTFGFSLQPYAQLSQEAKAGQNKEITRAAHGWVKNHSLYRR